MRVATRWWAGRRYRLGEKKREDSIRALGPESVSTQVHRYGCGNLVWTGNIIRVQ